MWSFYTCVSYIAGKHWVRPRMFSLAFGHHQTSRTLLGTKACCNDRPQTHAGIGKANQAREAKNNERTVWYTYIIIYTSIYIYYTVYYSMAIYDYIWISLSLCSTKISKLAGQVLLNVFPQQSPLQRLGSLQVQLKYQPRHLLRKGFRSNMPRIGYLAAIEEVLLKNANWKFK